MIRFHLSYEAGEDLDELAYYLGSIPKEPALRIGRAIQATLDRIAEYPAQSRLQEQYSLSTGREIRSTVCLQYVIFFASQKSPILFLGVLHGRRDIDSIMRERLA